MMCVQMIKALLLEIVGRDFRRWMFAATRQSRLRRAGFTRAARSTIRNDLDLRAYPDGVLRQALGGQTNWAELTPRA